MSFQSEFAQAFSICATQDGIGVALSYKGRAPFQAILYYPEHANFPVDMNQGKVKIVGADVLRTDWIANGLKVGFILQDASGCNYTIADVDMADPSVPIGTMFLRTTGFPP
jgi:hypothetical protein